MIKVGLLAVVVALGLASSVTTRSPMTRHDAKIRTFKALLHETELPPDAADATHASITVAGCRRTMFGFRCRGSLAPVAFSGIDGSTCRYIVRVYPKTTHLVESGCE